MIIGISGKSGSGKDTIGSIIQYLLSKNNLSYNDWLSTKTNSDWEIKKFAGKLKEIASILCNIPIENFENQEFKKLDMSKEWGMTYREFLQRLGTEALRNGLHKDVWVNALLSEYNHNKNWIVTDLRFDNEYNSIISNNGINIRVYRPCRECGVSQLHNSNCSLLGKEHSSEKELDHHYFKYKIFNNTTIDDLIEKVREILIEENLL